VIEAQLWIDPGSLAAALASPIGALRYVTRQADRSNDVPLYDQAAMDVAVAAALSRAIRAEAKLTRLTEWMAEQGLLVHHARCRRPDGTIGPMWVVRGPAVVDGGSSLAWHGASAMAAVETWLANGSGHG